MPMGVAAHQSPEDEAALEALREEPVTDEPPPDEGEPQSTGEAGAAEGAATEGSADTTATGEAAAAADKQTDDSKGKGDPRAALRAARRGEQRARAEAEKLKTELEELRKKVPGATTTDAVSDDISDEELQALEADFPVVAKAIKATRAKVAAVAQAPQAQAQPQADQEFEPPVLDPGAQEVVDGIPDLLAWQHDPDQTRFEMAKAEVLKLNVHPKWRERSDAERFAEATRRVAAEFDPPATTEEPPDAQDAAKRTARERIAAAQRRAPGSIADIGGGGGRPNEGSSLSRFQAMSEDEALAELEREG